MAALVSHDALGPAGGPRGVEDVEGIGGGQGNALRGRGPVHGLVPIEVAAGNEGGRRLRPLHDHAALRLVAGHVNGLVEQRFVVHDLARLDPAGGREDEPRLRMVDARGQLGSGEAAVDDRVDGADPGAGEHRHHRLGDHRHVDDHAVAWSDAHGPQGAGAARYSIPQLRIGDSLDRPRDRAVVDEGDLITAARLDVDVEGVEAGVEPAAREPPVEGCPRVVQDAVPAALPAQVCRGLRPERLAVLERAAVRLGIGAGGHGPLRTRCAGFCHGRAASGNRRF